VNNLAPTMHLNFDTIRRHILNSILHTIRLAAGGLTVICLVLLFIPGAPYIPLIALLIILGCEFGAAELGRLLNRYERERLAAIVYISITHLLALAASLLLESRTFFAVLTAMLLIMAIVLVDRWFMGLVGVVGISTYLLLPRLMAIPAIMSIAASVPSPFDIVLESTFIIAAMTVIAVLMALTLHLLRDAIQRANQLALTSEALRAAEAENNKQLNAQIEEQRRLIEVIRTLEAPIVPLRERVLVVPLMSYLDTHRLAQIEERVLAAINERKAELIFLDLTGVPIVDTASAQGLIRLGRTIHLLGAKAALTGLRPEIALAIVGLGIQLDSLSTYASIQEALNAHPA
jgi:anti-anti-sigma regulatory factor